MRAFRRPPYAAVFCAALALAGCRGGSDANVSSTLEQVPGGAYLLRIGHDRDLNNSLETGELEAFYSYEGVPAGDWCQRGGIKISVCDTFPAQKECKVFSNDIYCAATSASGSLSGTIEVGEQAGHLFVRTGFDVNRNGRLDANEEDYVFKYTQLESPPECQGHSGTLIESCVTGSRAEGECETTGKKLDCQYFTFGQTPGAALPY